MKHLSLTLLTLVAASLPACPCGCMRPGVDTQPERELGQDRSWSADFRHDAIHQDERNDGAHAHFIARHRYDTLTLETQLGGATWSLSLPRVERIVSTNLAAPATNTSQGYSGLGDASLTARLGWRGATVTAGLKLPTGESDRTLAVARRYLQLGTGSTDLILGIRQDIGGRDDQLTGFARLGAQAALASDDTFRPGTTLEAAAGVRWRLTAELTLAAQVTATRQFRDKNTSGATDAAYTEDLESSVLSTTFSPGLVWAPNPSTRVYLHLSEPLSTTNYATKTSGATVNPVHASSILSVGLTRQF